MIRVNHEDNSQISIACDHIRSGKATCSARIHHAPGTLMSHVDYLTTLTLETPNLRISAISQLLLPSLGYGW